MSDDLLLVVAVMLVTFLVGDGFGAVARWQARRRPPGER